MPPLLAKWVGLTPEPCAFLKLAMEQWLDEEVYPWVTTPDCRYTTSTGAWISWLAHEEAVQKEVFWSTASLLNLTVDLIFFDTTTPALKPMIQVLRNLKPMASPNTNATTFPR